MSLNFTATLSSRPTGKAIAVVGAPGPSAQVLEHDFAAAGTTLGMTTKLFQYGATAESITTAVDQALAMPNLAGIVSYGICPDAYPAEWATIQAKKIPVVGNACGGDWGSGKLTSPLLTTVSTQADNANVGAFMADWIIADSSGKANTLVVSSTQIPVLAGFGDGVKQEMTSQCPSCTVDVLNVPLSQLASVPGLVTTYLQSHPKVTYVFTAFSDIELGLPQALAAAGLNSRVKLVDGAASATSMKAVQGGQLAADAGWFYHLEAYVAMDAMARAVTGQSTAPDSSWKQPFLILTKANVTDQLISDGQPVLADYQSQFKKLWGVS